MLCFSDAGFLQLAIGVGTGPLIYITQRHVKKGSGEIV